LPLQEFLALKLDASLTSYGNSFGIGRLLASRRREFLGLAIGDKIKKVIVLAGLEPGRRLQVSIGIEMYWNESHNHPQQGISAEGPPTFSAKTVGALKYERISADEYFVRGAERCGVDPVLP